MINDRTTARSGSVPESPAQGIAHTRSLQTCCLLRDQEAHIKPVEDFTGPAAGFRFDASWDPRILLATGQGRLLAGLRRPTTHVPVARTPGGHPRVALVSMRTRSLARRAARRGASRSSPTRLPAWSIRADDVAAGGKRTKVEVAGISRLHYPLGRASPAARCPRTGLLVMTAKRLGLTRGQNAVVERFARDAREPLAGRGRASAGSPYGVRGGS